jgi:flagellar biosynthesis protein FlhG
MLFTEYGIVRFRILANMVDSAREGNQLFKALLGSFADNHDLQIAYAGYIPADDCLRKAVSQHQAVVNAFPRSRSAMALKNLVRRVLAWPQPDRASGHVEFFVERMIHDDNTEMEVMT